MLRPPLAAALATTLAGCATTGTPTTAATPAGETIAYTVGPCFGTCPVYAAQVAPDGGVRFDGQQHTAVAGARTTAIGPAGHARAAAALAPYRPATGTSAATQCEQQVSDQQAYTITWTAADGTRTTLTHDRGCISARNAALNAAMDGIPATLAIAPWIKAR